MGRWKNKREEPEAISGPIHLRRGRRPLRLAGSGGGNKGVKDGSRVVTKGPHAGQIEKSGIFLNVMGSQWRLLNMRFILFQ